MDCIITVLRERHLDAVAALEREVFAGPWSRAMLADDLRAGHAMCFTALHRDAVIGYVSAWLAADECTINRIACSPAYRRRGIGTRLLRHVLQLAAKRGAATCFLDVSAGNSAALALYARTGFQPSGLRRNYYPNTGEDAVLMRLPLESETPTGLGDHET